MSYRVFVSHSSKDHAIAETIKGQTGPGVELYLAEHDHQPGHRLAAKIQSEIDRCHAVLVLVTEASQASAYVHQEIGYAIKAGKLVIPVLQQGISGQSLGLLEGTEYSTLDFTAPDLGRDIVLGRLNQLSQVKAIRDEQLVTAILLVFCLFLIAIMLTGKIQAHG